MTDKQIKSLATYVSERLFSSMDEKVSQHLHRYNDQILSSKQVAEWLGKTTNYVDQLCKRGQIPFHKVGGRRYFSRNELIDYFLR